MKKALVLFNIICFGLTTYAQEREIELSAKILKTYVGKYEVAPNVIADVTTDEKLDLVYRLDIKLRELLLHNLTLNYEKSIQKLQFRI